MLQGLVAFRANGTEFGGVVNASTNTGFVELSREFRTVGELAWLRTSSASLARQGFNEVSIVPLPTSPGREPRSATLSPDLLALYWQCRTNLPVYPHVRQAWEVGNEPDFFWIEDNPDRMAAVIKAAYWGIKAENPKAAVLLPSLAFVPDKYPRELAANGVYPFLDGYNFHYYGWAQDFLPTLNLHRQFMARAGWDLPIWITEAGDFQLHQDRNTEPEDLARQQAFHERLAITAFAAGVDYYLPFILTPWAEEGSDLSLVTADYVPRPALESYLFLSRHLRGCRPCFEIWHRPTQSEIGVVLAEPDGDWLTALWTPYRWTDFSLPAEEQRPRNPVGATWWSAGRRRGRRLKPAATGARRRGSIALPGWPRGSTGQGFKGIPSPDNPCTHRNGPRGAVQPSLPPSTAMPQPQADPTAIALH
ncbi:MAG: hypothetical protein KGS61_13935, partial [Verrucomicrobia bacterium]|nr:hypothetical protein [Verrucomicrobiota bacterium]